MKTPNFLVCLGLFLGLCHLAGASGIDRKTYAFAIHGKDTLFLDKYETIQPDTDKARTCILFAFGGGFRGGDRARESYIPFFHSLARQGYVVVSTDYRTTLKDVQTKQIQRAADFIPLLQQAIATATNDFYEATRFLLEHQADWNIDPARIVACGSSAGAITALQAAYGLCNQPANEQVLPEGFRYAGTIAFAGAIASNGPLQWKTQPGPCLLFHGDADRIVPYKVAVAQGIGLWGSYKIDSCLDRMSVPHQFIRFRNASHEIADTPMQSHLPEISRFLERYILRKDSTIRHTEEIDPRKKDVFKDFRLEDYLRANR